MSEHRPAPRSSAPILGALAVSAFLLLWDLDRHSFWVDELGTAAAIRGSLRDVVAWCVSDIHPPLYFIGLKLWVVVAGTSDVTLRLFSALAALLSVALAGPLARRWMDASAALPATLLLGLHPALVEFGRMARYYSLTVLLGLASALALHHALERGCRRDWALYALSMVAAVYTFYPTAFLILAHVPFVARSRATWRRFALSILAVGLLCLPWIALVAFDQVAKVSAIGAVEVSRSLLGLGLALAASAYTFAVGQMLYPWNPAAACGVVAIALLLWAGLFRSEHRERWPVFAALTISVGLVALLTNFLAASTPFLNVPVRGLFALPFASVLLAHGLEHLPSRRILVVCIVLLTLAWGSAHASYFAAREFLNPVHYTPTRKAARVVMAEAEPGDVVLSERDIGFTHYLRPDGVALRHALTTEDRVPELLGTGPARVWLVTLGRDRSRRRYAPAAAELRETLGASYERVEVRRFLPIDPRYLAVKEKLLGRPAYRHRLIVELYRRLPDRAGRR